MNAKIKKKSLFSGNVNMLEGSVTKSMIAFVIPLILSGILQSLFNAADIAVVGNFAGKEAVAAVGATSVIITFLVNVSVTLATGVNVILSRAIGAGDEHRIKRTVGTSFFVSLALGVLIAILGELLAYPLLELTGCPENIRDDAALYMRVYFIGVPATMFYNFMSSVVRLNGDSTRPFIYLSISGVTNVVLNLVFVIGFGMAVAGVAIATVISLYLSAVLLLIRILRIDGACRLDLKRLTFSTATFTKIMRYGIPSSVSTAASAISSMYIQSIVNSYGDVGISGNTAAVSIETFMFSVFGAIYGAIPAFMGQNIGAGNRERTMKVLRVGAIMTLAVGLVFGLVSGLFGKALLSLYLPNDPDAISFGLIRVRYILTLAMLCAATYIIGASIQSFGYTTFQMVYDLVATCALRVVWLAFIYPLNPTPEMLYVCFPLSWVIVIAVAGAYNAVICRRYMRGATVDL